MNLISKNSFFYNIVTFLCLSRLFFGTNFEKRLLITNTNHMKDLKLKYETAKNKALQFMQTGQISAYINSLKKMNQYKSMMIAISSN